MDWPIPDNGSSLRSASWSRSLLLGRIVNGADTDNALYHQAEGPGLQAIAEGISATRMTTRSCRRLDRLRRALRILA